jgi:hypothetical protein
VISLRGSYIRGALNLENIALFDRKELFEKP